MKATLLLLTLALVIAGCTMPPDVDVNFDEVFQLEVSQQADLPDGTVIRFVRAEEDSRCPQGADCVWEGNAVVALELIEQGAVPRPFKLNTHAPFGDEVQLQGYTITLLGLTPEPSIQMGPLNPADYIVELQVSK